VWLASLAIPGCDSSGSIRGRIPYTASARKWAPAEVCRLPDCEPRRDIPARIAARAV